MSGEDDSVQLTTRGLDKLIAVMKGKGVTAKVGILGEKNARSSTKGQASNATIGACHEFGTATIPQRSFLRTPIADELPKQMESSGAFREDIIADAIKTGTFHYWVEKIAIMAVGIVQDAFDTRGYGKWKPSVMKYKKVKQTLVETGQLRDSITYEVR